MDKVIESVIDAEDAAHRYVADLRDRNRRLAEQVAEANALIRTLMFRLERGRPLDDGLRERVEDWL